MWLKQNNKVTEVKKLQKWIYARHVARSRQDRWHKAILIYLISMKDLVDDLRQTANLVWKQTTNNRE